MHNGLSIGEAAKALGGHGPALSLSLSASVPASSKLPASQQWVAVPPDALAAAQLAAGQRMLLGLADLSPLDASPTTSPSPSTRSPQPLLTTPTSSFAPTPTPDLSSEHTRLTNLWHSTARLCGARIPAPSITLAPPPHSAAGGTDKAGHSSVQLAGHDTHSTALSAASDGFGSHHSHCQPKRTHRRASGGTQEGASSPATQQQCEAQHTRLQSDSQADHGPSQQQPQQQLGEWLLAVRVWPCARLPRGVAALSSAAAEACGRPQPSTHAVALFRVPPSMQVAPVCTTLALQVCYDALRCKPATLPPAASTAARPGAHTPGGAGTPVHGAAGASGASTPIPARHSEGWSNRTGAATPPPPSSTIAFQPPTPSNKQLPRPILTQPYPPPPSAALGDWVLDLLTPPPTPSTQPAHTGSRPNNSSTTNSSSSNSAAGSDKRPGLGEAQRAMLGAAAARHLGGRVVLAGNPVLLPLLGHTLLCSAAGAAAQGGAESAPAGMRGGAAAWQIVAGVTQVTLVLQGEELPADVAAQFTHGITETTKEASHVGQQALPAWAKGRSLGQLMAAAREAAEDAVQGSGAGAAAGAAERALRSGLAAHSTSGFSALGGVASFASTLRELVALPLRAPHLFAGLRVRPPRGVLLHGPPGGGKTVLARAAASDAGAALLIVNGPDVVSEFFGESEAGLRGVFAAAKALSPAVVFIDEIDALAPSRGGGDGGGMAGALAGSSGGAADSASRLVTVLLTLMDGAGGAGPGDRVVVIAATNRPSALDPALRRPGRLERELEVGVPGPEARAGVLRARLQQVPHHSLTDSDIDALASAAHGYVGADLVALVNEAALVALRRVVAARPALCVDQAVSSSPSKRQKAAPNSASGGDPKQADKASSGIPADPSQDALAMCVTKADFAAAEARVRPSALRELAVEVPRVAWADVGGLGDVKQRLREAVEWPFRVPGALARVGAQAPRGVLLYGPPGCSKTLLARAVACEAKLNFVAIKGGELYSKYVGESERAIAALFARARATAPCIVFFDEIDGLAGTRTEDGGGGHVGDRVMAQLLSEMDGLQDRLGVVVLAATNRPDCVDPALLRPGRFDRLLHVPPPNADGRAEILKVKLRKTPTAQDVNICELASKTEGYTGADLGAVVREAGLAALDEDIYAPEVCGRHFAHALKLVPPSAPPAEHIMDMYEQFGAQS